MFEEVLDTFEPLSLPWKEETKKKPGFFWSKGFEEFLSNTSSFDESFLFVLTIVL